MNNSRRRQNKSKRIIKGISAVLAGLVIILGFFFWKSYSEVDNTVTAMYESVETNDLRDKDVSTDASEPISFALFGVDNGALGRDTDVGRSDAIIIGTINPTTKTTTLVSIPRDSYAEMVEYNGLDGLPYYDKITHAYAFGETSMAINSVQQFLNIPVDYYVTANMQGIVDIINAIGGIEVVSPLTFEYDNFEFVEGETIELDGQAALAFARMRHDDPAGDAGRQDREKLVVEALLNKIVSLDSLKNYRKILDTLSANVKTNLTFDELVDLQAGYKSSLQNFVQDSLVGEETYINEIYYLYVNPQERLRISNIFRKELGLAESLEEDLAFTDIDEYGGVYTEESYSYEEPYYEETYQEEIYTEEPYVGDTYTDDTYTESDYSDGYYNENASSTNDEIYSEAYSY